MPVPIPNMIRPNEKTPILVSGFAITLGAAEAVRTTWPVIATAIYI
jgi:hypothetical protein